MKIVRAHIISRIFAILTGIVFLNVSFFLTEIRILNLESSNHQLVENITKILSGIGFEEEGDAASESSDSAEQITDLHISICPGIVNSFFILDRSRYVLRETPMFYSSIREVVTPPPRLS